MRRPVDSGAVKLRLMTNTEQQHQLVVPANLSGRRLDAALAELCPDYSRTVIKSWIEAGRVTVNGTRNLKPRAVVHAADRIELAASFVDTTQHEAQDLPFALAYEDAALLVIDKPPGLVVHPGAGNPDRTLVNGLLFRFPALAALPRAGVIHRLDKDTSGLLLVARTPAAFQALTRQMANREIHRVYAALVHGVPVGSGTVTAALSRDRVQRTRMRVAAGGREAVTHYSVLKRFRVHAYLELVLETGRTHQIRVHMQHLGHPLLGDPTYAKGRIAASRLRPALNIALNRLKRQALHAKQLEFEHPDSGELITVKSALPGDFRRALRALGDDLKTASAPDHG
jgi:23S rRNA pseudouridine1911/1915/1917 synthase